MSASRLRRQWSQRTTNSCESDSNLTRVSLPPVVIVLIGGWEVAAKLAPTLSLEVLTEVVVAVIGVVVVGVMLARGEAKLLAEEFVLNINNCTSWKGYRIRSSHYR